MKTSTIWFIASNRICQRSSHSEHRLSLAKRHARGVPGTHMQLCKYIAPSKWCFFGPHTNRRQPTENETEMDTLYRRSSADRRRTSSAVKLKTTAVAVSCGDHTLDLFVNLKRHTDNHPTTSTDTSTLTTCGADRRKLFLPFCHCCCCRRMLIYNTHTRNAAGPIQPIRNT